MAGIQVRGLIKAFDGGVRAVNEVNFEVPDGQLVTLLGPSGCGKTTTLRLLAGFETPDEGHISFGDHVVTSIQQGVFEPPEKRGAGMVFQSYAIWPHMTVFENVAYPLTIRSTPKAEIRTRVFEALEMLSLSGFENRPATKLSGGQQQRVAIARALVGNPGILLLDEPLSNLDAKLRAQMRVELLQLQRRLKVTTVYVTHDQTEAMVLSDRVLVMKDGVVQQNGSARDIFKWPVNRFVADFVGFTNFVPASIVDRSADATTVRVGAEGPILKLASSAAVTGTEEVVIATRPAALQLTTNGASGQGNLNGTVLSQAYLGDVIEVHVQVDGARLIAHVPEATSGPSAGVPQIGDLVNVQIDQSNAILVQA
ncbi:MAG: ABC transporter ATP-binding protein [Chloroflexota bacterium]